MINPISIVLIVFTIVAEFMMYVSWMNTPNIGLVEGVVFLIMFVLAAFPAFLAGVLRYKR